ncbi:MAG: hypothetical protein U0W65_04305 [Bacteroidia bacterium]
MQLLLKYKYIFFIILAYALYGNTIQNSYSIDDDLVTNHCITTNGFSSIKKIFTTPYSSNEEGKGFEYRPIVKLSYAIEHVFFGVNPHLSHFMNVLLYSLTLILLFKTLLVIFGEEKKQFIFFTVLIFAIIPAHTEVVDSLKNRDILLCYIFSMLGFLQFNIFQKNKNYLFLIFGIAFMITAFLSKFDALPLLLLFPILLFHKTDFTIKRISFTVLIALVIYHGRGLIEDTLVGENMIRSEYFQFENPLYFFNPTHLKIACLLNSLGFYTKLLFFPFNLTSYYGYNTLSIYDYFSLESFLGFVVSVLMIFGLIKHFKNRQHPIFIGIVFLVCSISMYLNFILPAPGIVADRFVFFASTGFAIILSYFLLYISNMYKHILNFKISSLTLLVTLLCCIYIPTILSRNKEWKSLFSLVEADVKKYPNSVKLNVLYSNELISSITKKENYLTSAEIAKRIIAAKEHLLKAHNIDSTYYNVSNSMGYIALSIQNNPSEALSWFKKSYRQNPTKFETVLNMAICYEKINKIDSALFYFEKTYLIKPKDERLKIYLSNYLKSINRKDLMLKYYPS